ERLPFFESVDGEVAGKQGLLQTIPRHVVNLPFVAACPRDDYAAAVSNHQLLKTPQPILMGSKSI
ncbi:hypothetical protein QVM48_28120, partial [Pseudomonas soli]|uniref:hypothetical protein n=1 Tax=Pseudomonas soli TaxID=1306993 RepID=UPI0035246ABA